MARPVTLMSAALLTALVSTILPQVLPTNDARTLSPSNIAPAPNPIAGSPAINAVPGAATINQTNSKVVALDNTPIVFERVGNTYVSNLLLRNSSGWRQKVSIDLEVLRDREKTPLTAKIEDLKPEGLVIEPFAVVNQRLDISITSPTAGVLSLLPASGSLRLLASPQNADTKPNVVTDPKIEPPDPGYLYLPIVINEPKLDGLSVVAKIFFSSLIIAALIVLTTIIILSKKGISLLRPMGGASWSFEQSWGTNVTIGAAILNTFLTLIAFPSHPHIMEKTSYSLLQGIFAALIALAPLVYGLIRNNVQVNANGVAAIDTQGFVITFLLGGGLVLWGAFGQVFTFSVLIQEFILGGGLARSLGLAIQILAAILCLLLMVYGVRSLYLTAKDLSKAPQQPTPPSSGTALTASEQATFERPMPEWPLL